MLGTNLFISFSATDKFAECDYSLKYAVRRAIEATLEYEDFPYGAEISVTFCDNEYIKQLNKKFRDKDSATDVLSFPMVDFDDEEYLPLNPDRSLTLGDIVISVERAAEQARELGNSPSVRSHSLLFTQLSIFSAMITREVRMTKRHSAWRRERS